MQSPYQKYYEAISQPITQAGIFSESIKETERHNAELFEWLMTLEKFEVMH